jgi:hypothetical protein
MKKVRNGFIKNLRYFCLPVVIVFGLIAIVGSNGGGDGDGDSIQSLTITGESGNQVNLNGSWSEGCVADDGESEKSVTTISGSSFSVTMNMWTSSTDCSGTSDVTNSISGTFTLGEERTVTMDSSNVTATKVDAVISTAQFTINNPDMLSDANTEGTCGYTDWVAGTAKDVLGTDCAPDTSLKDIIYIDDTADPDLWYDGIESDDDGYPTELDADSPQLRM